jgi:hypothetical protein
MHRIRGAIIAVLGFGWEMLNYWHLLDFVLAKLQTQGRAGNLVATALLNPLCGLVLIIGGLALFARDQRRKERKVIVKRRAAGGDSPAPPATHVTPANTAVTPQPERVYLRESIKEVVDRIRSLKPLEKTEVSNQSYVGRWVRWSGRVLSIEAFALGLPSGSATVTVSDSEFIYARLEYLPTQRNLVEAIEVGDAIDYEARVTKVLDGNIYLTDATVAPTKPVMVDVTPEYLWGLFEGRTSAQAEQRVADYIGKWMLVSGPLGDVKPSGQVTFQHKPGTHTVIYVYFHKKRWLDRLSALHLGENISVRGRIEKVNSLELHLETCELIDSPGK